MSCAPSLSVSKSSVTTISYKWPVNFTCTSCFNDEGEKSPIFPADAEEASVQWQIKVLLNEKESHVGLWLYGSAKHISSVRASFSLSMKESANGKSITNRNYDMVKTHSFDSAKGTGWTEIGGERLYYNENIFSNNRANRCMANKPLTIHCTINIYDDQPDTPEVSFFYNIPRCSLWHDFENLLYTGKNTDVTLVAKGNAQKLNAHKTILMARSPVFDAMFNNQLKENLDSSVVIDDLDFDVLDEMVRFMYSGKVSCLSNVADRLLMAADKYDLPRLRVMCEQEMGVNLSVENAAQTLILADLHHASQLRKHTLSFIKHRAQSVLASEGWQEIKNNHPNLLADVCQSLAMLQLENKPCAC